MRKRVLWLFSLLALSALLLTACGGANTFVSTPTLDGSQNSNDGNSTGAQVEEQTVIVSDDASGNQTQSDQSEQATPAVLPALPGLGFSDGDAQLKASDPNQLDLTSGELHLVELFAFW